MPKRRKGEPQKDILRESPYVIATLWPLGTLILSDGDGNALVELDRNGTEQLRRLLNKGATDAKGKA